MPDLLTIDSSVFIAALNPLDTFTEHSRQLFAKAAASEWEIILPTIVVCEVANVLIRQDREMRVFDIISYLEPFAWIDLDMDEVLSSVKIFSRFQLKTSDAIVATIALRYRSTLLTWDEQLLKESAKHMPAYTPSDFLARRD